MRRRNAGDRAIPLRLGATRAMPLAALALLGLALLALAPTACSKEDEVRGNGTGIMNVGDRAFAYQAVRSEKKGPGTVFAEGTVGQNGVAQFEWDSPPSGGRVELKLLIPRWQDAARLHAEAVKAAPRGSKPPQMDDLVLPVDEVIVELKPGRSTVQARADDWHVWIVVPAGNFDVQRGAEPQRSRIVGDEVTTEVIQPEPEANDSDGG